jgi:hypothetical protein
MVRSEEAVLEDCKDKVLEFEKVTKGLMQDREMYDGEITSESKRGNVNHTNE